MESRIQQPLTDIGKFYKQIEDFKGKICTILQQLDRKQEMIEIEKYYDKLTPAKKANVRKPIELLYEHGISVYAKEILLREEQFFIGEAKNLEKNGKIAADYELNRHDLLFIEQIRSVWDHLTPIVKKNIWDYVQIICLLAEKIVKKNVLATEKLKLQQAYLL